MRCPKCGKKNEDNWPLWVDGEILYGGCQECYEDQCDREWWNMVNYNQKLHENTNTNTN